MHIVNAAFASNLLTTEHQCPDSECSRDIQTNIFKALDAGILTKSHEEQVVWVDSLYSTYRTPAHMWLHSCGGLPWAPEDTSFWDLGHTDDDGLNTCVLNNLMRMGLTAHAQEYLRQLNEDAEWGDAPHGVKFRVQHTMVIIKPVAATLVKPVKRKASSSAGDAPATKTVAK